jgi:hypothetical protein
MSGLAERVRVTPMAFGALFGGFAAPAFSGGRFNANLANPLSHSY